MIQFQPAQDVKDALKGKTPPPAQSSPQAASLPDTDQKSPLAMRLDQSPKLAGIFKNSAPEGEAQAASLTDTAPAPPESPVTPTEAGAMTGAPAVAEPTEAPAPPSTEQLSALEAANAGISSPQAFAHSPTDPHGVHDTAHPDEPEPGGVTPAAPVAEPAQENPAEQTVPQADQEPNAAAVSAPAPVAPPETPPAPAAEPVEKPLANTAPEENDFRARLRIKLEALDTEIAKAEAEEARLLSEAAKATTLVKTKKTERKQLETLQNIDPATLESVFKVMQDTDDKKAA